MSFGSGLLSTSTEMDLLSIFNFFLLVTHLFAFSRVFI